MTDFYEIDFLPVHTSKSGDAIAIRYQIGAQWFVHVVDGGYTTTAPMLSAHIRQYFQTDTINNVVVTHSDKDHAEGLAPVLEEFNVEALWMLRPWSYCAELMPHFARYDSAAKLTVRLKEEYPYIAKLEEIAIRKRIPIFAPHQGQRIGPFVVLAPSLPRYLKLVIESEKTPQQAAATSGFVASLFGLIPTVVKFIKAGWGSEKFSAEETSAENEMSVVQYALMCGERILLTGDAGRGGMTEAADFAPYAGLQLPGISKFQVPHHGGRRNLSTAMLDRWIGPRLPAALPSGSFNFVAMISSAKEDTDHPRKAVVRALLHRGAFVATTENSSFRVQKNSPAPAWNPMTNVPYPDEQEE